MISSWESNVDEVAQTSIRHANHFVSCISNQNQKRSIQEVSLIAQEAINGFRKLLTILDEPMQANCKRTRKGPLRNFNDINPVHMMDSPIAMPQGAGYHSKQSRLVTQVMPLQNILPSTRALTPSGGFNLYWENQKLTLEHFNSETNLMGSTKLITGLNPSSEQQDMSIIRVDGNHVENKIIPRSSPEIVSFQDESSGFSTSGMKRKQTKMRCVASTSGCHCSKRKLRKKKTIQVPAVSNKLADIPPDDYSWRKYGQKPIKGSPHPRSYYRCTGMKECTAKKLVERCLDDPTMLVVTYVGDHNHLRI